MDIVQREGAETAAELRARNSALSVELQELRLRLAAPRTGRTPTPPATPRASPAPATPTTPLRARATATSAAAGTATPAATSPAVPQLLAASARLGAAAAAAGGTTAATKVLNAELRLLRAGNRRLDAENRLLQRRLFDLNLELLRRGAPRRPRAALRGHGCRDGVRLARPEEAQEGVRGAPAAAQQRRTAIADDTALAAALQLAALAVVDLRDKPAWAAARALVADSVAGVLSGSAPTYA